MYRPPDGLFCNSRSKILIDLNSILMNVRDGVYTEDRKTGAKINEHPIDFSNNTLYTFFSRAELFWTVNSFHTATTVIFILRSSKQSLQLTRTESELGQWVWDMITWKKQRWFWRPKTKHDPALWRHTCWFFRLWETFGARRDTSFTNFAFYQ